MNTKLVTLQIAVFLTAHSAFAQDSITLPLVPTIGVSPVLSWALSVLSIVLTITLPLGLAILRQRFNVASSADRNAIIDRAVKRGGLISYGNQQAGTSPAEAAADALAYVKNSAPESIAKTDQATDAHLANAIAAEVTGLNQTSAAMPLLTPIPAAIITAQPTAAAQKGP